MTARITHVAPSRASVDEQPLTSIDVALAHVAAAALRDTPDVGRVGLELELHLVDLRLPARRPDWAQVQGLIDGLDTMPAGSSITAEPGGQLELSTPPAATLSEAVQALRRDRDALRVALAGAGFGGAALGADPARPVDVVNRGGRYGAMQQHFASLGCSGPGRAMMASTAALQVNLDAGPSAQWQQRVEHLHRIGPVLIAMSACSPMLARHRSGWRSMRQQAWGGIDAGRVARFGTGPAVEAWAEYALAAPVMLVRDHVSGESDPVPSRVPFASWITGAAKLVRRPTLRDLDYHLTTLFPPVRPRGYLELRYLDAVPDRWWPALAAITTVLGDDAAAADAVDAACEPVADAWIAAARDGLATPLMHDAARACARIAVERAPADLRADVEAYAELIEQGRTPGDEVSDRITLRGPLAVLEEDARA